MCVCDCVPTPPTGKLDMLCPSTGVVYVCALTHTKAMCVPAHGPICADMCAKDKLCACVCLVGCSRGGWSGRAKPFPMLGSLQSQ